MNSAAADLVPPPIDPSTPTTLTPRDFLPIALSMTAVLAALVVQHLGIEAVQRWRQR